MLDSLALAAVLMVAGSAQSSAPSSSPTTLNAACLHGDSETPVEARRRRSALGAARTLITVQAQAKMETGRYLGREQLANTPLAQPLATGSLHINFQQKEVVPGFELRLLADEDGYLFTLHDITDPCGFSYGSSERGVIVRGETIR